MTAPRFFTVYAGFRVSSGASLGFLARCGDDTPSRVRQFLKTAASMRNAALPAKVGGVGASSGGCGHGLHADNMRGERPDGDGKETASHAG